MILPHWHVRRKWKTLHNRINAAADIYVLRSPNALEYINVILLHSNHRYISVTHMTIFRVVRSIKYQNMKKSCSTWSTIIIIIIIGYFSLFLLGVEVVSLKPNPQTGEQRYPFSSGSTPLTCLAWEALPIACHTSSIDLGNICLHKPHYCIKVRIASGRYGV
jgi:hypothetical protein